MRLWRAASLHMVNGPVLPPSLPTSPIMTRGRPPGASKSAAVQVPKKRKSDEHGERPLDGSVKTVKPFAKASSSRKGARPVGKKNVPAQAELDDSVVQIDEQPLGLDLCIARRRSWTPVRDENPVALSGKDKETTRQSIASPTGAFTSNGLIGRYGYVENAPTVDGDRYVDCTTNQTTRRRIELARPHHPLSENKEKDRSTKPKATAKKKPRTITDTATELYRRECGLAPIDVSEKSAAGEKAPKKRRLKKGKLSYLNTLPTSPLLSPAAAQQAFESQERVFGTCSQLLREDSPTTIRDLQRALKLSLEDTTDACSSAATNSQSSGQRSVIGLVPSSRKLWEAAARDEDGKTLMPEIVDLTDSPIALSRLNLHPSPALRAPPVPPDPAPTDLVSEHSDSDLVERPTVQLPPSEPPIAPEPSVQLISSVAPEPSMPLATPIAPLPSSPKPSNKVETMPDYTAWSDEDLKAVIKAYGFKAMRNRKNMIARLEKCWDALHPSDGQPKPGMITSTTVSMASASSSRAAAASKAASGPVADKPHREPPPPSIRTLATDLTTEATQASVDATAQRDRVFAAIERAVLSAPPASDPKRLGWYEKILLYDPIVIEDLTLWLNQGQLTRVGTDEEVAPSLVRDWCESRSICCLWRLNLRGKERTRF